MKLAAIDIGTNSTRLLITNYHHNKFITLERKMEITRLGRDLDINNNFISGDSAEKTLKVLSAYRSLIRNHNVSKHRAIGTSALRKAVNGKDFISSVEKDTGIKVDVLSGREEASLSFYGAVKDINVNLPGSKSGAASRILVIDIGGGSSEFIVGDHNCNLEFTSSIDIGCVSLTERFINSGVPDKKKINQMYYYIEDKIRGTIEDIKKFKSLSLVGVAGTITTLAAIDLKLEEYDSEKIHGHILNLKRIEEIHDFLCGMNLEERKKVTGLDPKTADIIISGKTIMMAVLRLLGCKFICVSERDILDGIVYTLIDF